MTERLSWTPELAKELAGLGITPTAKHPLYLLFATPGLRPATKSGIPVPLRPHVQPDVLPTGSVLRLSEHVAIVSPELCFLQMASTLSLEKLILMGFELCGTYALLPDPTDPERTRREELRLLRIQLADRGGTWQWRDLPRLVVRALRHPVGTFRLCREMRLIRRSGLFSEYYYRLKNPEIAANFHGSMLLHFCLFGWREGRDPSVLFSVSEYLRRHLGPEGRETNPLIRRIRAEIRENAEDHER